jgi:ATP-dependent RNA helicase DeaD
VGFEHGVKPGNIIGAIANEAGLDSQYIGRLSIRDDHSLIDLPEGMPQEIFEHLRKVWVSQQQLRISAWNGDDDGGARPPRKSAPARRGTFKPPRSGRKAPPRR